MEEEQDIPGSSSAGLDDLFDEFPDDENTLRRLKDLEHAEDTEADTKGKYSLTKALLANCRPSVSHVCRSKVPPRYNA